MAAESRGTAAGVAESLFKEAHRFDFFQAVRLLERTFREAAREDPSRRRHGVGGDHDPAREIVRFKTLQSLTFPRSAVHSLRAPSGSRDAGAGDPPPEMAVTFFGLTGPNGVLPYHYSRLLIERARARDFGLQDFLDMFMHRLLSLFYRAWEKYRLPEAFERSRTAAPGELDLFSRCVMSLAGYGTPGLRERLPAGEDMLLYYSGFFADVRRPALSLEHMLSEFFTLPVHLVQFTGQWLSIDGADRTRLPGAGVRAQCNRLGVDAVLGARAWSRASRFRARIGPMAFQRFREFLPSGTTLGAFCRTVRLYAGPELDFDVEVRLRAADVPPLRLGVDDAYEPRLGWTTWLPSCGARRDHKSVVWAAVESSGASGAAPGAAGGMTRNGATAPAD